MPAPAPTASPERAGRPGELTGIAAPAPRTGAAPRGRAFGALDGLRAWAVVMVFHVHFFEGWWRGGYGLDPHGPWRQVVATIHSGHVGVDLFFVLSGFLIHYTLQRMASRGDTARGRLGLARFLGRRYRRLLPAHLVVVLPLLVGYLGSPGASPGAALANVALVQSLLVGVPVLNFVTWSLSYELLWYAMAWGWVAAAARSRVARSWLVVVAAIGLTLAGQAAGLGGPRPRLGPFELPLPARFAGFFFGFGLAKLRGEHPGAWRRAAALFAVAGPVAIAAVFGLRWQWTQTSEAGRAAPLFSAWFYGGLDLAFTLVLAAALTTGTMVERVFARPWLQALGRVSYSTYLAHALYGIPLGSALAARLPLAGAPAMAAAWAACAATTVGIGALLFHYLERPYFVAARARQG